jgi:hypothetical protein
MARGGAVVELGHHVESCGVFVESFEVFLDRRRCLAVAAYCNTAAMASKAATTHLVRALKKVEKKDKAAAAATPL